MIDQQLAAFLHDGIGIHLGTRNATLEPNGARAIALKVEDRHRLTVYMADVAARRVMPDLEANGMAAVVCGRPVDERACQVKGLSTHGRSGTRFSRASNTLAFPGDVRRRGTTSRMSPSFSR